jgi:8-oxo-dGTP pyrophosphatase MutT (NUDIX family)
MRPTEALPVSNIRAACTVVLLRDATAGLEVLLLRRDPNAKFMPGFQVFAGGAVVPEDRDQRATARVTGLDDAEASRQLRIESGGLAYWLAGVRETFEECGMLLAVDEASGGLDAAQWAAASADRAALNADTMRFADFLDKHRVIVSAKALVYFDHWLTPAGRPRRFDTRFLLARAPQGQTASHEQAEIVDARWLRPQDALAMAKRKEIDLANATTATLAMLAEHATVEDALERARSRGEIEPNRPCTAQGAAGPKLFLRSDAAYHEVHWCDPLESMQTTYDLLPGNVKQLDRWVARIIAPNRGPMTGPGTNTYFVGGDELAVIDPGPLDERHLAALLAHGAGRIRWIVCTHSHRDHSPNAARLAAATGAEVIGMPPPGDPRHDSSFATARVVRDGDSIELGNVTLTALVPPHT